MPTDNRTIHFGRTPLLALAFVVPIIATAATTAHADNETAAAIEPPYRLIARQPPLASSRLPALPATSSASATTQQDEYARDIYKPGISDR